MTLVNDYEIFHESMKGLTVDIALVSDSRVERVIKLLVRFVDIKFEDIRVKYLVKYKLSDILTISFIAMLAGCNNFVAIEHFSELHREFFEKFLNLKNFPSHDTIGRVFLALDNDVFNKLCTFIVQNMLKKIRNILKKDGEYTHFGVDGKALKGSAKLKGTKEEIKCTQTLNVFNCGDHTLISSKSIKAKTNEIPVAQSIYSVLNLENCIISGDALHCQYLHTQIIRKRGGEYLFGLKKNQRVFFDAAVASFEKYKESLDCSKTEEIAHNQKETRESYLLPISKITYENIHLWVDVKNVIVTIKKTVNLVSKKETEDISYHITSLDSLDIAKQIVRDHWEIENGLHWQLDNSMGEDKIKIYNENTITNFSIMLKCALTILKYAKPILKTTSIVETIRTINTKLFESLKAIYIGLSEDDLINKIIPKF